MKQQCAECCVYWEITQKNLWVYISRWHSAPLSVCAPHRSVPLLLHDNHSDTRVWQGCKRITDFAWGHKSSVYCSSPNSFFVLKPKMRAITLQQPYFLSVSACVLVCAICPLFFYFRLCQWKPALWSIQSKSVQREWQKEAPASDWHSTLTQRYSTPRVRRVKRFQIRC